MGEELIIRRRRRWLGVQLISGLAIGICAIILAAMVDGFPGAALASVIAAGALLVMGIVQSQELRRHPQALVATREYLGLLGPRGARRYIRWDEVIAARHSTSFRGMRWLLHTLHGAVAFADPGVDPDRWGLLWRWIARSVVEHRGQVRVDALSNSLFDQLGRPNNRLQGTDPRA